MAVQERKDRGEILSRVILYRVILITTRSKTIGRRADGGLCLIGEPRRGYAQARYRKNRPGRSYALERAAKTTLFAGDNAGAVSKKSARA
jgi:hypothetical protein